MARYASADAITATSWNVPLATFASFAAVKYLLPLPPSPIPQAPRSSSSYKDLHATSDTVAQLSVWPILLSHCISLLDTHTPSNTIPLLSRFHHIVSRRVALALAQILHIARTCHRLTPADFFHTINEAALSPLCLFTRSLPYIARPSPPLNVIVTASCRSPHHRSRCSLRNSLLRPDYFERRTGRIYRLCYTSRC